MAPETSNQLAAEHLARDLPSTSRGRSRRSSTAGRRGRAQRNRLRAFYFSLASLWGFLIGTVALLFGFTLSGDRLDLSPMALGAMSAAIVVAVIGGAVASRAYREARRRDRF